jgi:hypothetical protein
MIDLGSFSQAPFVVTFGTVASHIYNRQLVFVVTVIDFNLKIVSVLTVLDFNLKFFKLARQVKLEGQVRKGRYAWRLGWRGDENTACQIVEKRVVGRQVRRREGIARRKRLSRRKAGVTGIRPQSLWLGHSGSHPGLRRG